MVNIYFEITFMNKIFILINIFLFIMIEYLKYLLNKVQKLHEGIKNLGKTRLMISEAEKKAHKYK